MNATATLPNGQKVTGKVYRNGKTTVQTDVGWNYNPGRSTYQQRDDGADPVLARRFRELGEGKDPTAWEKPLVNKIHIALNTKGLCQTLKDLNVTNHKVKPFDEKTKKELTEEKIIERLGGKDMTNGSCISLALSYIGNKYGLNVLDFRGGRSRLVFSFSSKKLCRITGSQYVETKNSLPDAIKRLEEVEEGKEYFFVAGNHAAIVRRNGEKLEFLELQNARKNGFKELNEDVLQNRFYAKQDNLYPDGSYYYTSDCLIDAAKLGNNQELKEALGYLNTYKNMQLKGER